jgi:hypothetical protein
MTDYCCDCGTDLIGSANFVRRCTKCDDAHKKIIKTIKELRDLRLNISDEKTSIKWEDDVEDIMYRLLGRGM